MPFSNGNKSASAKKEENNCETESASPSKVEAGLYRKLRSKMNQSITDMQGMFGSRGGRDDARVLSRTLPAESDGTETPAKKLRLKGRRSFASTKKRPLFIPGVTAVTEVGAEDDSDDDGTMTQRDNGDSP